MILFKRCISVHIVSIDKLTVAAVTQSLPVCVCGPKVVGGHQISRHLPGSGCVFARVHTSRRVRFCAACVTPPHTAAAQRDPAEYRGCVFLYSLYSFLGPYINSCAAAQRDPAEYRGCFHLYSFLGPYINSCAAAQRDPAGALHHLRHRRRPRLPRRAGPGTHNSDRRLG